MTNAASPNVKIDADFEVKNEDFQSYVVDRDMYQPDMAAIVLSNREDRYSTSVTIGAKVKVKVKDSETTVFDGEVVGMEPIYKGGEKGRMLIRCMNKMHRLLRYRKSLTFVDKTDQQILSQIVGDAELGLSWEHEKTITYKHVYQHNQTHMEFLRMRAARMGCHVWCVGDTIFVKQPDLKSGPIATLKVDEASETAGLRMFNPRMSSGAILKKVTCKGWNPEKKELITGVANAKGSKLGSQQAVAACGKLVTDETFTVDHPIWAADEATALAEARLQDANLSFITGEAECTGDPVFDLGKVVKITPNEDPEANPGSDPFNGNYYIMGVTHRHIASKTKEGGYVTILRLARDMAKE